MTDLAKLIDSNIANIPNFPKEGIQYKDISPIFLNSELCSRITDAFCDEFRGKIDAVCGIESRGFLFGIQIAEKLEIPFIMIRKQGKLPPPVYSCEYDLEYGKAIVEIKKDFIKPNLRVLVHDDILATGGTAEAAAKLVLESKGILAGFCFISRLKFLNGMPKIEKYSNNIQTLIEYN